MAWPGCVIFDFDGVLVDSNHVKRQAYFSIFADFDSDGTLVESTLALHGDGDRYQIIGAVLGRLADAGLPRRGGPTLPSVAEAARAYNDICEEYAATCPEILGATEALSALAARCPLYINSATPQEPLRRIVERRGWSQYFREVLGRPQTKVENLRRALEQGDFASAQAIMVGDGRHDLEAARSLGCCFVGVRNAFNDFDSAGLTMLDDLRGLVPCIAALSEENSCAA